MSTTGDTPMSQEQHDVHQTLTRLEDRLDELEAENKRLREENQDLRDALQNRKDSTPSLEYRGDEILDNLWIDNFPVGKLVERNRQRSRDNVDRISDIEAGEIDTSTIATASSHQLPIQQYTALRKRDGEDGFGYREKNIYRATFVWADFAEHAETSHGRLKLSSSQVRNIMAKDDGLAEKNPNPNTVKRVMKTVAKYSTRASDVTADIALDDPDYPYLDELLVTFRDDSSENVLWADEDDWNATFEQQEEQLKDDLAANSDDLHEDYSSVRPNGDGGEGVDTSVFDATPITSDGEDTLTGDINSNGV